MKIKVTYNAQPEIEVEMKILEAFEYMGWTVSAYAVIERSDGDITTEIELDNGED